MSTQKIRTAVIGGTGFGSLCTGEQLAGINTPYGDCSAAVIGGSVEGGATAVSSFGFIARHGNPHRIPPHKINYRANLWALKQLGVERVIAVNAVGGINPSMPAGALVLPDQIIDYSYGREHSFSDSGEVPLEHVDFSFPFDSELRTCLMAAATDCELALIDGGVYGVTQGPRLETAAEINRFERDGCDIVGMTAMPEAGLARELGMAYASLSLVVNPAAGRSEVEITMDDIHAVSNAGMAKIKALLLAALARL